MKKLHLFGAVCSYTLFLGTANAALVGTNVYFEHRFGSVSDYRVDGQADVLVENGPNDRVGILQGTTSNTPPGELHTTYLIDPEDDIIIIDFSICAQYSIFDCTSFNGSNPPNENFINGLYMNATELDGLGMEIVGISSLDLPSNRLSFESDSIFIDMQGLGFNYTTVWTISLDITSAVPVPASAWLFGSGLLGLVAMARRKRAA